MTAKSGGKSERPGKATRFREGPDPRRGRGPAPGAPNAGRPPNAFAARCREIADRESLLEMAAKIAAGKEGEIVTIGDSTNAMVSKPSDRIAAMKLILAYGHGQPVQPVDTSAATPHEEALEALE